MEMKLNKQDLLNAMKGIGIVSNESGPVKTSKVQMINAMTDKLLKPVTKPQDSDEWDNRRYEMNPALTSNRKFLTVKDMYSKVAKVVTEATTKTPYHGMRLNLKSIDIEETHCKFIITRRDVKVMVELYYPNANNAISVHITTESGLSNLYEVELESQQFQNNFGITILKSIDELIGSGSAYNIDDDMNSMEYTSGLGTPMRDVGDTIIQPSAMIRESVDGRLSKLLKICNEAAMLEADEQAPGAAAFAAQTEEPNPMEAAPASSGEVNGTTDNGSTEVQNVKDFFFDNKKAGELQNVNVNDNNGDGSMLGNLKIINAAKAAERGEPLSEDEEYEGKPGTRTDDATSTLNKFFSNYPDLANSDQPVDKLGEFMDYLSNPGGVKIDLGKFEVKMKELFPSLYPGDDITSPFMNTDDVSLPNEDLFGSETAANDNDIVDFGALGVSPTEPATNGGDFMNDGSVASMVDQLSASSNGDSEAPESVGEVDVTNKDAGTAMPNIF